MKVHIVSDGRTVWVNDRYTNIARFGHFGIDIHNTAAEQMKGNVCIECTHERTSLSDWRHFQVVMKRVFDIEVSDDYMPVRFK